MLNSLCLLEGKLDLYCVYLCPSNKWLLRNNLVMNLVYITFSNSKINKLDKYKVRTILYLYYE